MRLPEVVLDDRRFQDLVNEARHRIGRNCREWTDHNVSDPGITLVELFAWMTDMLVYRVNRVPDKLHVALLELLGVELDPPSAATCELRFMLAGPALEPVPIPAESEVGTDRSGSEDSTVFQLAEPFVIPASRPRVYLVSRDRTQRLVATPHGVARPDGTDRFPFGAPPDTGDALYLGFDEPLDRLVLRVDVVCTAARGAGVVPTDPPLAWEVSQRAGTWAEAQVIEDATGGFNLGSGSVTLQLPAASATVLVGGRDLFWVRCRVTDVTRSGRVGAKYTQPPSISSITASAVGALLPAEHAARVVGEPLGYSDGTPGQSFRLRYAPVLEMREHERLEVRVLGEDAVEVWHPQDSFATSGPDDRHFILDEATGEIQLGPAIREKNGVWTQRGAIPPKGAQLWMTSYRYGGGQSGNVAAKTLHVLKSPIAGVAAVHNPLPAVGGVDLESLDSARRRAALDIRSRSRAVTTTDFEFLAGEADPRVARATCVATEGRQLCLHVLPRVMAPFVRPLTYDELMPDAELLQRVSEYLDERRLVGTSIHVAPARLRGVSADVQLRAAAGADTERIEREVADALYRFLNPVCGGTRGQEGDGWEFGRPLSPGELHGVIHEVSGVETVLYLRVHETNLKTGRWNDEPVAERLEIGEHETIASGRHVARAVQA